MPANAQVTIILEIFLGGKEDFLRLLCVYTSARKGAATTQEPLAVIE